MMLDITIAPTSRKIWMVPESLYKKLKDIAMKYDITVMTTAPKGLISYELAGIQPMTMPTGLIFSLKPRYATTAASWGNFPMNAAAPAIEKEKTTDEALETRWIPLGTKFTMKASGALADVSESVTGKCKITINKCQSDWMTNKELQRNIKETIL